MKLYTQFYMGQGGEAGTSTGIIALADAARQLGIQVDLFDGVDITHGYPAAWKQQQAGYALAAIGYSEGCGDVGWIEQRLAMKFCALIDPSRDCINYKLRPENCPDSILFHNNNWLARWTGVGAAGEASDPGGDLGCRTRYEYNENHLVMDLDTTIHGIIENRLANLVRAA